MVGGDLLKLLIEKEPNGALTCQVMLLFGNSVAPSPGVCKLGPVEGTFELMTPIERDEKTGEIKFGLLYFDGDCVVSVIVPVENRIIRPDIKVQY